MRAGGAQAGGDTDGRSEPALPGWSRPVAEAPWASVPESRAYRLKRLLLGPPLISDQLADERLGKPTALAVLSSDVMSSSAYATEEILRILLPVGGLAAFGLVTPITLIILAVLAVVTACYRQVVKSYPKAGGSYVVSRDNFGPNVAQVAGAALLISYTITVAVSVAAGTDAIISAIPSLSSAVVPLSIGFVVLIAYANLRGLREAGKLFAVPTYADRLVKALSQIPHVNATVVPFNVADLARAEKALSELRDLKPDAAKEPAKAGAKFAQVPGATPITDLRYRQRATIAGRIRSIRVQAAFDAPELEATITDASGGELLIVFMGRKSVPGIRTGTQLLATGTVGAIWPC